MFQLPTNGIARSINEHNSRLDVFSDWLEASVLFSDSELSRTDVVDALIEHRIYDQQDFADQWVTNAWGEIERRQKCIGNGSPYDITPQRISRKSSWEDVSAYSFCLLLSLVNNYSGLNGQWQEKFRTGYIEQGELFELLTKESLEKQFPDWRMYHTGWSRSSPSKLIKIVDEIAAQLGETKGNLELWTSPDAHEAGLDLLFYRPFEDNRVGIPLYLLQCASGGNWTDKLHTPCLKTWTKVIQFAATPRKAFATPFALEDGVFCGYCNLVDGLFLDRYRLLSPSHEDKNWLSTQLNNRIKKWLRPRIKTFPAY
ncbi:MAG: hypothetical protein WCE90_01710 [Candidatus Zixiibacteriota bacterium]